MMEIRYIQGYFWQRGCSTVETIPRLHITSRSWDAVPHTQRCKDFRGTVDTVKMVVYAGGVLGRTAQLLVLEPSYPWHCRCKGCQPHTGGWPSDTQTMQFIAHHKSTTLQRLHNDVRITCGGVHLRGDIPLQNTVVFAATEYVQHPKTTLQLGTVVQLPRVALPPTLQLTAVRVRFHMHIQRKQCGPCRHHQRPPIAIRLYKLDKFHNIVAVES
uniref:Uncharacterized protein n=1 Tax=Lygus hesperus TaxID=30085 RepID=A0A146M2J7_LYGHE